MAVSSLFSVSDRICTVATSPLPTMTTDSASLPRASWNTSSTCWVVAPPAGIETLVPPSKSMPKVNPRMTMLAMAISRITPLMANHSLRFPMTSKAPVPV